MEKGTTHRDPAQRHQLLQEIATSCTYRVRLLKPTCAWVKARANKRMWVNSIPLASSNSCNFWRIESKKSYCQSALNRQYFSERKTIVKVKKLKRKTWRSWDDAIRCLSPSGIWAYKKIHGTHWIHLQTVAVISSQADTQGKIARYSDKSGRTARSSHYDKVWMRPPAMITRSGWPHTGH